MNAGPYPTKEMFEVVKDQLSQLFIEYRPGGGLVRYTPTRQLGPGPEIYSFQNADTSIAPETPIKTVELSWQNVPTSFDALSLQAVDGETLLPEDIDELEVLPLGTGFPMPGGLGAHWLPRKGWTLTLQNSRNGQTDSLPWMDNLKEQNNLDTVIGIDKNFPGIFSSGCVVRITFAGTGTTKISLATNVQTDSHPGVLCAAKDAAGNVLSGKPSMRLLQRNSNYQPGFLPPSSLPMTTTPTPIQDPVSTYYAGTAQGMEIVWPMDGTPYLHVFRQGSSGAGQEWHLPLTPGLPQ